jgi:uroporphyrinogen-III synthase
VAVTRDEGADGPLSRALREAGLDPVRCTVIEEQPADAAAIEAAAGRLEAYDFVVCSSPRSVHALVKARGGAWPRGVATAAVGAQTASVLVSAGADPPPLVPDGDGADPLWALLSRMAWRGKRVLLPGVKGGRRRLAESLRAGGALVEEVEAYRMLPRDSGLVAAEWQAADPNAAVIASPSTGTALVQAVGAAALDRLAAVVAIGPTTAAALREAGVRNLVSPRADWGAVARLLAGVLTANRQPRDNFVR